jgi:hypothetical protein
MEMKKLLESLEECGMNEMPPMAPPMDQHEGSPVSMNVSLNASGKEHVEDLISMMKNAGMQAAAPVDAKMLAPRLDMERLRSIVDGPMDDPEIPGKDDVEGDKDLGASSDNDVNTYPDGSTIGPVSGDAGPDGGMQNPDEDIDEWDNSPEGSAADPDYRDVEYMTKDLSGGINREKKAYKKAQDGDNAMAVEAIKAQLMAALQEKKAKPDFLDMDGDGDKKEPMKKAIKDKKAKK